MSRLAVSMVAALVAMGLTASASVGQQQPEATVVQIHPDDQAPGWWLMDIPQASSAWHILLGDGCENAQAGEAILYVFDEQTQRLVLPDATPGTCQIEQSIPSDQY